MHAIHTALYTLVSTRTFRCTFYEIPDTAYQPDGLPDKPFQLNDPGIKLHHGTLIVDFSPELTQKGSFKTAHPGKVTLDGSELPPFTNGSVCVKQVYRKRENSNVIARVKGRHELDAFSDECNCLRWASILLDLTYQFVARESKTRGALHPIPDIPTLRFTRTMIAIVQDLNIEKAFLVEEWINVNDDEQPFVKYINNRFPQSSLSHLAPPKAHKIADFLIFAQHVQWEKSQFLVFTSDYQGAGELLTDPQIMSDPYVVSFYFVLISPVFYQRPW